MGADLVIEIDLTAAPPAYRQIADAIRPLLISERLKPGDTLPAARQLARDLGVRHNTVVEAYQILVDEGWIEMAPRRGAVVIGRRAPRPSAEARQRFGKRLRELVAEAAAAGVSIDSLIDELQE